jgi:GNAT superfamily N-acetyltransferase
MSKWVDDYRRGVDPHHPGVLELLDLLEYEYIGMYGEPDPNPQGGLEFARGQHGSIVVAESRKKFVGIAGITMEMEDGPAILHRMFVRYELRKLGIAAGLLRECEHEARRLGARALLLETGISQTSAIALYRSHGYEPVDPFGYYADQPTSVFLGKRV